MTSEVDNSSTNTNALETPPPDLPSPPPQSFNLDSLDPASWEHLEKLCEQLLSCSKVSVDQWKDPLMNAIKQLNTYLSPEVLGRLGDGNAALAKAALELVNREKNGSGTGELSQPAFEGWMYGKELLESQASIAQSEGEAREKRRERWRHAAMLISVKRDDDDEDDEAGNGRERHLRDMTIMSSITMDEAWLEVEAMEKLSILSLHLETNETTLSSVTAGETMLSLSFEENEFVGCALFGRGVLELDENDLKVVDRIGGTFKLVATKKSLPRLERLIEFLAFALISLRLEAVLLDNLGCPRPVLTSTSGSPCPSPVIESTDDDTATKEEEEGNSSVFDLPGSYNFDETEPDEDWGYTKRSWRSSFSNSGVLAWMRLANPRAQMPLKSNRSLRRSSTVPSNDPSPRTLHKAATISAPIFDSPSPSPSPSRSPDGKRKKVANKLRGIRNQLRDKIGRTKGHLLSPAGSDDEEEDQREPPEQATGGGGGNTSVLGLQIAGIDLKSSSWSLPWSNSSSSSKPEDGPTTEMDDNASIARTEMTADEAGEKLPPKRFEKVIEDLSQFILSTSPDVLYPPPHLLFRLRQQELEASLVPAPSTPKLFPSTPPSPSPIPAHVFSEPPRSGFLSPRSASTSRPSALQRAHALPSSHSLALNFAEGLPTELDQLEPEERRTTNSSTATRIGLDARASLASLMTNNSSLGGTLRHQAMQFLLQVRPKDAPVGATPCEPFKWLTTHYCDSRLSNDQSLPDTSIEAFVRNLVMRRDDKCSHCDQLHEDHVIVLLHHDEKIEITLSTLETLEVQDQIAIWNSCGICKAQTTRARLSGTAGSFSFAKFIELILYDPNFIPMPELCEHASSERSALVRCFALGDKYAQLKRSTISLYELRLPTAVDPDVVPTETDDEVPHFDSLEELKNEIDRFFRSIREQSRTIRRYLDGLPPSPPASPEHEPLPTSSESSSSSRQHVRSDSEQTIIDNTRQAEIPSISQVVEKETAITAEYEEAERRGSDELELLRRFDNFIDEEERACRNNVERFSPQELNLGRSAFQTKAEALKARLSAWQEKHVGSVLESPPLDEPVYFGEEVLALPTHSNVLLRSDELSSVLAVALSTPEFKEECQTISAASSRRVTPSTPTFSSKSRQSSLRLPIPTFATTDDPPTSLDPDDYFADFSKPSQFELIAKPKKPPRTSSGSVFRNLVRKKSGEISGPSTPTSEHGSFTLDSKKRTIKDSVLTDFLKTKDLPPTSTRTPRAVPSIISGIASRREGSSATTLSLTDDVLAQFASSGSGSAAGTIRSKVAPSSTSSIMLTDSSSSSIVEPESDRQSPNGSHEDDENDALAPLATDLGSNGSRLFEGIRSGLDSLRSRTGGGNSPRLGTTFEESTLSTSEHIKLKMTQGDKKFSVTAYFPRRFKDLRARCGLSESLFIESLSRCTDLNPSGGKSSAAFLMTGNSRFMLKELVTKFGYSELDSLLSFAPRLLDYQMQADRPSLLSKIFGIYSIKIQDLKTGEKRKLDMIVMDNLFHGQTISRQFDLKGIASRVAKPKPGEEATKETGWDSDWLQGSVRNQLLLYPHSRTLLLDSISNDVEFLSSNGNIDFSLLVGVDDTKCTLVVGLIDTLGVFNTIKVLEHSAKKGIKMALSSDTNSVTVCPPTEYAKRFLSAMETYFVAVPDKWSKPPRGEPDPDPRLASPL
ncbi:hypothetical protein JCM3765_003738 [Sporobolomyces pararoseus]